MQAQRWGPSRYGVLEWAHQVFRSLSHFLSGSATKISRTRVALGCLRAEKLGMGMRTNVAIRS